MPTKTQAKKRATKRGAASKTDSCVAMVSGILEGYAAKGVFRGFSAQPANQGRVAYRMIWHHDRGFDLRLDAGNKTLQFADVLPGVPADSAMYRELKAFLKSRQSVKAPEHRRVNPAKARLRAANRRGSVSIALTVIDGDFEYGTRKIVHIVHELFLTFLVDGPYFDYLVEQLGFDPDRY